MTTEKHSNAGLYFTSKEQKRSVTVELYPSLYFPPSVLISFQKQTKKKPQTKQTKAKSQLLCVSCPYLHCSFAGFRCVMDGKYGLSSNEALSLSIDI